MSAPPAIRPTPWWRAAAWRALLFAAGWAILTGGSLYGRPLALATILGATLASLALVPPAAWRWRPRALLGFLPFFLWQSARGGVDVAARALRPGSRIRPGELVFPLRLPPGPARTFFAAVVGLLPGTLSLRQREEELLVHVLDDRIPVHDTLHALEDWVAELFGVD